MPEDLTSSCIGSASVAHDSVPVLRKLTRPEAREEQRRYRMRLTPEERLHASTELTRRMYLLRGIDLHELEADWTARRVPRSRR